MIIDARYRPKPHIEPTLGRFIDFVILPIVFSGLLLISLLI
jgi:hypothetical protein